MFNRSLSNYAAGEILDPYKTPLATTEISTLDVRNLRMQTVPGELLPELAIGGYTDPDQPYTDLEQIVSENNPNPPDLSQAPEGPYIKELMASEYNWIIGLGNDELGYFVPSYNYKLSETSPYFNEAAGIIMKKPTPLDLRHIPLLKQKSLGCSVDESMNKNLYDVLGVVSTATHAEIRKSLS